MEVASGIAGLVALTDLLFGKIFWYVKTVKNAPREIAALSTEIRTLSGVLHSLSLVAAQLEGEDYDTSLRAHHVYYCHETLENIKSRLQKFLTAAEPESKGKALLTKLKWPFSITETKEVINDIQKHKSTLSLALSADSMSALLTSLSRQSDGEEKAEKFRWDMRKRWEMEDRVTMSAYHRRILAFFTRVDHLSIHEINLKLRHPGTCLW